MKDIDMMSRERRALLAGDAAMIALGFDLVYEQGTYAMIALYVHHSSTYSIGVDYSWSPPMAWIYDGRDDQTEIAKKRPLSELLHAMRKGAPVDKSRICDLWRPARSRSKSNTAHKPKNFLEL